MEQVRREAEEERLNLELANKAAKERYDSTWGGKVSTIERVFPHNAVSQYT